MRPLRVYLDTSVAGGCFDPEFRRDSLALFKMAREGKVVLLVSSVLFLELEEAPPEILQMIEKLPAHAVEPISTNDETAYLRDRYIEERVVTKKYLQDATHVATASVHHADIIVSWNFRHLVNVHRIRAFNAVNFQNGFPAVDIRTPTEVLLRNG